MSTTARLPDLGANPIEDALRNYQQMEHDLGMARSELAEKGDMLHRLMQENEFLRRNHDKAVAERDRYQALAVNLATRAVGVKEAVERLLVESVNAKAPPSDDVAAEVADAGGLAAEMEKILRVSTGGKGDASGAVHAPGGRGEARISAAVARGMMGGAGARLPEVSWMPG